MFLQSVLALAHPTKSNILKTWVEKSLETVAEAVYTKGTVIPDNNDDLEEKAMWVM